jgi:hypothetical protein
MVDRLLNAGGPPSDPSAPSPRSSTSRPAYPPDSGWLILLATVTVRATLATLNDGTVIFGPPKSAAGRRTVTVREAIRDDLRLHLRDYLADEPSALIFTGAKGAVLRRSGFQTQ